MKQFVDNNNFPFVCLAILVCATAITTVNCDKAGRRISDNDGGFKSPCGVANQVASRVGNCLEETFEILEAKVNQPKSDDDLLELCGRFERGEKCAKNSARECLHGLHKTSVGAVASATRRFRLRECKTPASRARYVDAVNCVHKKGKDMTNILQNHTAMLQGARDLSIAPEQKLMKMCCILNSMDMAFETSLDRDCPKVTPFVMGIVHAMTDDARSTLCVAPKCNGALNSLTNVKYKPPQNLLEPVMQILFQINTD